MNWKARKETINVGTMELDNLTFDEDYMEVALDVFKVSDELQVEINKAIEIQKVIYADDWNKWYKENLGKTKRDFVWSNKPVVIDFNYLRVILEAGKPIKYSVETGFHDSDDDHMETCASTTVDLSDYEEELKKAVVKVLIDRFF